MILLHNGDWKTMKILIDTNVALDYLMMREPFFKTSLEVLLLPPQKCEKFISVKQAADIFYLTRRSGKNHAEALSLLIKLSEIMRVTSLTNEDFANAITSGITDFEDALLAYCAKRHGIDYIITRNVKDFVNSPVSALAPDELLNIFR